MNPFSRTLVFLCVAGVSALLAFGAYYGSQPSDVAGFADVGQQFFPDFDDAGKAVSLSVFDYDDDEKGVQEFSVSKSESGLWTIPSHHDYPAEAEDRLAKTATSLLNVTKVAVQSRSKADWKRYGVEDPSKDGAAEPGERGTRLTLSDGSNNALVDLIIGKQVEGREGHYFVREPMPEKQTTYIAELDIDLSAKFSDWIEPDLLKLTATNLVTLNLDNYSVNEQRGTIEEKELLEFAKKELKSTGDWALAGFDEEAEEFDNSPVTQMATSLAALKIVGVRPKPEGLDDNLKINPAVKQILQMQMQAQGYFIGGDQNGQERLFANEGELQAGLDNGVQYTLYFGEIARGTGKDIEIGLADDTEEEPKEDATEEEADDEEPLSEDGPRRYLLVKVEFNDALLGPKPVAPLEPTKPEILQEAAPEGDAKEADKVDPEAKKNPGQEEEPEESPDGNCDEPAAAEPDEVTIEAAQGTDEEATTEEEAATKDETPDAVPETDEKATDEADSEAGDEDPAKDAAKKDPPVVPEVDPKQLAEQAFAAATAAYQADKTTFESDLKKYEEQMEKGKEKVEELSTRFAGWYYVISSDSFEKFRITRNDVVSAKKAEEDAKEGETEGVIPEQK